MFNCQHCGATIPIKEKFIFRPDRQLTCANCSKKLKPFKLYYYAIFFVAPFTTSFMNLYLEFNALISGGIAFALCMLLFVCQPMQKA
ncbi:hypothetical protein A1OS_24085 [Enterovibrio norvegicus]|nr:hypothetical protein A1OS_24085 [Enterovibrio norvegicus]